MKRIVWTLLFLVAAVLITLRSLALAQDSGQIPKLLCTAITPTESCAASPLNRRCAGGATATSIPMWSYSVTASRDGNQYSGVMVGRSPFFHGARTTNIPVVIIPVKFIMTDHETGASTFDPTATDATCSPHGSALTVFKASPILNPVNFTMPFSGGVNVGSGQYIDEFQRANFWSNVSVTGSRYHTTLIPGHGSAHADRDGAERSRQGIPLEPISAEAFAGRWVDWMALVGSRIFTGGSGGEAQTLIASFDERGNNFVRPSSRSFYSTTSS